MCVDSTVGERQELHGTHNWFDWSIAFLVVIGVSLGVPARLPTQMSSPPETQGQQKTGQDLKRGVFCLLLGPSPTYSNIAPCAFHQGPGGNGRVGVWNNTPTDLADSKQRAGPQHCEPPQEKCDWTEPSCPLQEKLMPVVKWEAVEWNTLLGSFDQPREIICVGYCYSSRQQGEATYNTPKRVGIHSIYCCHFQAKNSWGELFRWIQYS